MRELFERWCREKYWNFRHKENTTVFYDIANNCYNNTDVDLAYNAFIAGGREREQYIKDLESRLESAAETNRTMQITLASIMSEREREKQNFDSRETILRDHFAMSALTGLINHSDNFIRHGLDTTSLAQYSFKMADAMLAERTKKSE